MVNIGALSESLGLTPVISQKRSKERLMLFDSSSLPTRIRTPYAIDTITKAVMMNIQTGTPSPSSRIDILKSDAQKESGMKTKASSVRRVTVWVSFILRLLSLNCMSTRRSAYALMSLRQSDKRRVRRNSSRESLQISSNAHSRLRRNTRVSCSTILSRIMIGS